MVMFIFSVFDWKYSFLSEICFEYVKFDGDLLEISFLGRQFKLKYDTYTI